VSTSLYIYHVMLITMLIIIIIYDLYITHNFSIAIASIHTCIFTQNQYRTKKEENTHLKCSLVIDALPAKVLSIKTTRVVKTENKAPNPKTTRYPTVNDSGDSPPK